jgi:hypothetical protein
MSLFVQESFVNKTKGGLIGESDVYETRFDTLSELYHFCLREYGRCTGKVRIDRTDGTVLDIGWVFEKSEWYEDLPKERYLREVWVTVHDEPPTKTIKYQYHDIGKRRRRKTCPSSDPA